MTAGNRALGIVCGRGWASGPYSTGIIEAAYLAQADGPAWRILDSSEFARACGRGNPLRIPADVLAQSPCGVS